jgi:hypothetical protein
MLHIRDRRGNIISSSRNLRGIREAVSHRSVVDVSIQRLLGGRGELVIVFRNEDFFETKFEDFEVLKDAIKRWRNLYGAPLNVQGRPKGEVEFHNPALQPLEQVPGPGPSRTRGTTPSLFENRRKR